MAQALGSIRDSYFWGDSTTTAPPDRKCLGTRYGRQPPTR